jgi:hypothetical protein
MEQRTLENFLIENGISLPDMALLGSGDNGTAWRCGGFVVKQTRSKWEYDFAVKQTTGEWPLFARIHATARNESLYFYVADFLQKDDEITNLFQMVDTMLATQKVRPPNAFEFDYERFCTEYNQKKAAIQRAMNIASGSDRKTVTPKLKPISDAVESFYHQLVALSLEYRRIGASDLHEGNLGWDANGNLKAFDIDLDDDSKEARNREDNPEMYCTGCGCELDREYLVTEGYCDDCL